MHSGIGDTLRAARRARGLSLSDAAHATRVRETYLTALEQGDFAALGGDVYARGFLRSYARFLGLDPEPLVRAYLSHDADVERRSRPSRRRRPPDSHGAGPAAGSRAQPPQERPPGAAVLLLLVLVVLLVVGFLGLRGVEAGAAVPGMALGAGAIARGAAR